MEAMKRDVGEENIEVALYRDLSGKYCVSMKDLDANEVIEILQYPTLEAAERRYAFVVGGAQ